MADEVTANKTTIPGGPSFRTDIDPADGAHVQVQKIQLGAIDEFGGYVSTTNPMPVSLPIAELDAFGRLRVSNPLTLFDSKQTFDNQPLIWDDAEESGSGTTSSYSQDEARTRIGVALNTAGKRTRQTFMRFNYQPGKSQLILMTGRLSAGGAGIKASMGLFDDDNGIFVSSEDGVINIVRRSNVTGTPVDTKIAQSSWNVDPFDGTGPSGVTLDPSKTQIFWIDLEWLGVGRVRCGWVVDGQIYAAHEFRNTNVLSTVYMSTPNLPLRYQIENDGTGAATDLDHICSTVISEGGSEDLGVLRYKSTEGTHLDLATGDTLYPVLGIRLKSTALGGVVKMVSKTMINATADDFEWVVCFNPTLSGAESFSSFAADSFVEVATADGTNTVTDPGVPVTGGLVKSSGSSGHVTAEVPNALRLGAAIDGTRDEIWLCCRPLSNGADIDAGICWRELQ